MSQTPGNKGMRLAAEPYITERGSVRITVVQPEEGYCMCGEMREAWTCTKCNNVTCLNCWSDKGLKTCEECEARPCQSCGERDVWTDDWHQKGCSLIKRTSGKCAYCALSGDGWIGSCCIGCSKQVCLECDVDYGYGLHFCGGCNIRLCDKCFENDELHEADCKNRGSQPLALS